MRHAISEEDAAGRQLDRDRLILGRMAADVMIAVGFAAVLIGDAPVARDDACPKDLS